MCLALTTSFVFCNNETRPVSKISNVSKILHHNWIFIFANNCSNSNFNKKKIDFEFGMQGPSCLSPYLEIKFFEINFHVTEMLRSTFFDLTDRNIFKTKLVSMSPFSMFPYQMLSPFLPWLKEMGLHHTNICCSWYFDQKRHISELNAIDI